MSARQVGPWGTAARAAVGAGLVGVAAALGPDASSLALGLLGLPAAFGLVLAVRGRQASPLRLEDPIWHCVNIGIGVALFNWVPVAAMLFYGTSMLVAAWRGIGACEIFAMSNWLRNRDDRLGCPLFLPVDSLESRKALVDERRD